MTPEEFDERVTRVVQSMDDEFCDAHPEHLTHPWPTEREAFLAKKIATLNVLLTTLIDDHERRIAKLEGDGK